MNVWHLANLRASPPPRLFLQSDAQLLVHQAHYRPSLFCLLIITQATLVQPSSVLHRASLRGPKISIVVVGWVNWAPQTLNLGGNKSLSELAIMQPFPMEQCGSSYSLTSHTGRIKVVKLCPFPPMISIVYFPQIQQELKDIKWSCKNTKIYQTQQE